MPSTNSPRMQGAPFQVSNSSVRAMFGCRIAAARRARSPGSRPTFRTLSAISWRRDSSKARSTVPDGPRRTCSRTVSGRGGRLLRQPQELLDLLLREEAPVDEDLLEGVRGGAPALDADAELRSREIALLDGDAGQLPFGFRQHPQLQVQTNGSPRSKDGVTIEPAGRLFKEKISLER